MWQVTFHNNVAARSTVLVHQPIKREDRRLAVHRAKWDEKWPMRPEVAILHGEFKVELLCSPKKNSQKPRLSMQLLQGKKV